MHEHSTGSERVDALGRRAVEVIICMITRDFSVISNDVTGVSLSLSLSQKSLTHNIGSASALPIIISKTKKLGFCKVTNFRPAPIFVLLTWNWFIWTNFRTFEELKTKWRKFEGPNTKRNFHNGIKFSTFFSKVRKYKIKTVRKFVTLLFVYFVCGVRTKTKCELKVQIESENPQRSAAVRKVHAYEGPGVTSIRKVSAYKIFLTNSTCQMKTKAQETTAKMAVFRHQSQAQNVVLLNAAVRQRPKTPGTCRCSFPFLCLSFDISNTKKKACRVHVQVLKDFEGFPL